MARIRRPGRPYVVPIDGNGNKLVDEAGRGNFTLVAGTTYFFLLDGIDSILHSAQIAWDAFAVLTITFEASNMGEDEVSDFSVLATDWTQHNEATGGPSVTSSTGGTVTNKTIAVAGGTAGAALYEIGDGSRRSRFKVVVGATGGVVRVGANGKD